MTTKTPFLNSPLISLHHKSVNKASCTKTNISIYRDCFIDIPVELVDIPIKLIDILTKFTDILIELADMPVKVI